MEFLLGLLVIAFGIFVFVKSNEISEIMQRRNDSLQEYHDATFHNVRGIKKLLTFLFVNSGPYYQTKTSSRNVLIFLSPFIILLGFMILLMGLGIEW